MKLVRVEVAYIEGDMVTCMMRDEFETPAHWFELRIGRFNIPKHRMTQGMLFDWNGRQARAVRWRNGLERHQHRRKVERDIAFITENLVWE